MKIAAASAELWRYRAVVPITPSGITTADLVVTTLHADDGASGLGFSVTLGAENDAPLAAARAALERFVTGHLLRHPLALWSELAAEVAPGPAGDAARTACAAIDLAMWDLHAIELGVPIGVAMGGIPRRVPVYGSSAFKRGGDPEEAVATALEYVRRGARGVKVRAEGSAADAPLLEAVARALAGRIELMVDANGRCDERAAGRLLRDAAAVKACFVEEPLPPTELEGYARLARTAPVAIATGENLRGSTEAEPYLSGRWCSLIQPDLTVMGGLSECLRTAQLAERAGVATAPHFLPGVFVQLAAAVPHLIWLEDFVTVEPLFSRIPAMDPDGFMTPPVLPGHGLEFAAGARSAFRIG